MFSSKRTIKKLAIVKLSAMGDIIHAMISLQFIKKKFPNIQIDWIVESAFSQVLENNPDINNIYKVNLKGIKKDKLSVFSQIKLIKKISRNNYDLIIDAQGLIKSSIVSKLLGSNTAGFDKKSTRESLASVFYSKKINIAYEKNVIDRNAKVISTALDFSIKKEDILTKKPFLFFSKDEKLIDNYIKEDQNNVVFIVGASCPSKIYSKEKFVKLANKIDSNVLIAWGNIEEKEIAQFISKQSNAKVLPKLNLSELKCLIANSDLVIGNDTGPTHMAWALNIPSITLFGNTPGYRNTYTTKINKILESNSEVNPCKLDKNDFSISSIDENKIESLTNELLKNKEFRIKEENV